MEENVNKYKIVTTGYNVLFRPFGVNPFRKKRACDTFDLATVEDLNELDDSDKELTGKINELEQTISFGLVTEVGPNVNSIKVGDFIYYNKYNALPIPFYDGVDELIFKVHESEILAAIRKEE